MKKIVPSAAAVLLLLAACGGGGDGPAAPTPPLDPTAQVPPSANDSSSGLIAYLDSLLGASAGEKEPVGIDDFNPKQPDDTEPDVVS